LFQTAAVSAAFNRNFFLESERYFMAMITLQNSSMTEVTILSNTFIDNYMPEANGEFVKVYIYLLRSLSNAPVSFSLEQMADRLLCTERDILRALKYWAKQELLVLDFTDSDKLCGIALLSPDKHTENASSVSASVETVSTVEQPAIQAASAPSAAVEPSVPTGKASSDKKQELTPERIRELKQNEEIIQILYIAEQYLGKTLSPTESQKLLFFYDGLGLSADLIEYLLEYCVSHNHKSIRYIEKVAIAWAEEGITTVEQAKRSNSRYNKEYFTILKALGITNRNPVETEITLMDTWLKTYCFSMEIIQEACNRTVLQTGQASFQYTDKILEGWKKKEVKTLDDIRSLDDAHQKRRQSKKAASRKPAAPASNNRFNNFEQREYDFSEYEKHLLNQ
jgi:DnaD/phage-associated family protein